MSEGPDKGLREHLEWMRDQAGAYDTEAAAETALSLLTAERERDRVRIAGLRKQNADLHARWLAVERERDGAQGRADRLAEVVERVDAIAAEYEAAVAGVRRPNYAANIHEAVASDIRKALSTTDPGSTR